MRQPAVHLLYPSNPLQTRHPDEQFAREAAAAKEHGFGVSLFSFEDFQSGAFRASPELPSAVEVLYRGWMLTGNEYESLASFVTAAGAKPFTPPSVYLSTHHLPNWYPVLTDLTPETRVFPADCNLEIELQELNWPEYFIKDYVKSLKTSVGSRISSTDQISAVISDMNRFRGKIEGGFCVRRVEDFLPETERRYFVFDGHPCASGDDPVPEIVLECARRIHNRFFSVDVVKRTDGALRIVEVGDGQVSDLVGWTPERFVAILAKVFLPKPIS